MNQAVIYEVRLEVDPEIAEEFDTWLAEHVAEMLGFTGFLAAEVLAPVSTPTESSAPEAGRKARIVRLVQYHVASRTVLEHYFRDHADRMRQQGIDRFGDKFSASRDVYDLGDQPYRTCQNCSAALRGQYCEVCGQRDKHRIISLWELLRDLVGDVFDLDSRVWRSLFPLLFSPGRLTTEYLRGRRVHYTPPLRLYLISSLLFFLVVFFNTGNEITFNKDMEASDIAEAMAEMDADEKDIAEVMAMLESARIAAGGKITDAERDLPAGSETDPDTSSGDPCSLDFQGVPMRAALEKRATKICQNLVSEGGATRFLRDLIDNAPGTMFVFLPVIALVMAFLYPLSRRYYVEHLLFFVHFHSFFFLILTLTVLFSRLPEVLPGQSFVIGLSKVAVWFYIHIYLFVAMRRVYKQSFAITAVKYTVLGVAYFLSLLLSITTMAFLTALSV